ncbi:MAG: aspartate carbamoyltransferase catalytic subunit [Phycisphaerales bacterium]
MPDSQQQDTGARRGDRATPSLLSIGGLGARGVVRILARSAALPVHGDGQMPLRGATLVNAFFEDSTRTRVSFEIAAHRLGATVVNLSATGSSLAKGESLLDTVQTIDAMAPDYLVVRHARSGIMPTVQKATRASVLNAGDGRHQHPTQALLDMLTIIERLGRPIASSDEPSGVLAGISIAIVGDVLHSRVARSTAQAALMLGARVVLAGPVALCPNDMTSIGQGLGQPIEIVRADGLDELVRRVDVIYALRIQLERQGGGVLFPSTGEYARSYQITRRHLDAMKPGAILMHPGPVNRGVELAHDVVDDPQRSAITEQVANGVRVRMGALLDLHETRQAVARDAEIATRR